MQKGFEIFQEQIKVFPRPIHIGSWNKQRLILKELNIHRNCRRRYKDHSRGRLRYTNSLQIERAHRRQFCHKQKN